MEDAIFTPSRSYMHYDDVPQPLHFTAGTSYEVSEELPTSGGLCLVVRHPDQADDVLLRPDKIALCNGL